MNARLALDGGTTNTRAIVLRDSHPPVIVKRAVGARDVALSAGANPVARAVSECLSEALGECGLTLDEIEFIAAGGMLTSNVGLVDVPHLPAPVSTADLAAAVREVRLPAICDKPIRFIPGVKLPIGARDDSPPGDMMRGEECETFGLMKLLELQGPARFLLPGSHSKLVDVDAAGRIVDLRTSLTGEAIAALARQTVLAASLPDPLPSEPDFDLVRQGFSWTRREGMLHAAFGVRLAQVLAGRSKEDCASLLAGVVVGADALDMVRSGRLDASQPIWIAGAAPLRTVYGSLLKTILGENAKVEIVEDALCRIAPAVGAVEIVSRALSGA